ncbi:MAG TPA: hypothetical protein DDY78_15695 [Planctomycetales bacterium]|nr:hypothetical protein [Planctomycetales bacterium]
MDALCAMGPLAENGMGSHKPEKDGGFWMNYRLRFVPRPIRLWHSTHKNRRKDGGKGMKNESDSQRTCDLEGAAAPRPRRQGRRRLQ